MTEVLYVINDDNAVYRKGKQFIVYENNKGTLVNAKPFDNLHTALIHCKTSISSKLH